MPVKVIIDTIDATSTEIAAFNGAVAVPVDAISKAASTYKFDFGYHTAAPLSPVSQADVYKETMATIRYYGGVRYIFLPVYLTAMAALASQYFKPDNSMPQTLLESVGLLISSVLLICEVSLSNNLRLLWGQVEKMIGDGKVFPNASNVNPLPHRANTRHLWFVRGILCLPYLAGIFFWGCVIVQWCHSKVFG